MSARHGLACNMRRLLTVLLGLVLVGTSFSEPGQAVAPAKPRPERANAAAAPVLQVRAVARGLNIPWDVKPVGGGRLLITERSTKRLLTLRLGKLRRVAYPASTVWARGETGLMGLAVDPAFRQNRRFYTCQGGNVSGGGHDVRVMAWRLGGKSRRAFLVRTLLAGLPATAGTHGGCRLLIATSGALFVGTGDATIGTNPRNLNSLGGKTLRLNRFTGAPWPQNPWIGSSLAQRPLCADLRAPQRPGPGPTARRLGVVGRARARPRRRGEPTGHRR